MMTVLETVNRGSDRHLTDEQILHLLPRLWSVVADLVAKETGFGYNEFVMVAQQEYTKSKIRGK